MTDLENREAFLLEIKGRGYLFEDTSWMTGLGGHSGIFEDDQLQMVWEMWNASTQRQGFKLVPLEPNKEMIDSVYDGYGNYVASTDGSPESIFKVMINAV